MNVSSSALRYENIKFHMKQGHSCGPRLACATSVNELAMKTIKKI